MMDLALLVVGDDDRDWARAMLVEFEEAARDHRALGFAAGCLLSAFRLLPTTTRGCSLLVRYAFALGIVLPFAVFHLGCSTTGIRYLVTGYDPYLSVLRVGDTHQRSIGQTYAALAPVLTFLLAALGAGHLIIAWQVAGGKWRRAAIGMAWMGITVAALLACIIAIHPTPAGVILQCSALTLEILMIPLLAWWCPDLRGQTTRSGDNELLP